MIFCRQHTAYQTDLEKFFEKKVSEISKEEILSIIPKNDFDREYDDSNLKFTSTYSRYENKKTWWQRLNHIWILPLWLVIVGPLHWLFTGKFGLEQSSKIGILVTKLTGE